LLDDRFTDAANGCTLGLGLGVTGSRSNGLMNPTGSFDSESFFFVIACGKMQ